LETLEDFDNFDYDVYGFEEAQFFDGIANLVEELFLRRGKIVLVATLNGNYLQKPFGEERGTLCNIARLMAMFSHVTFTTASCSSCGREASYSCLAEQKTLENEKTVGDELYASHCVECMLAARLRVQEQ